MDVRANRLPILLTGIVVVIALFAWIKRCGTSQEATHERERMHTVPQAPPPDADSPADTVRRSADRS